MAKFVAPEGANRITVGSEEMDVKDGVVESRDRVVVKALREMGLKPAKAASPTPAQNPKNSAATATEDDK